MQTPAVPENEIERLRALRALNILDTDTEERFDRVTRLAKRVFQVPICLVSLVDENRQWFKSCQGLSVPETPRNVSICGHAIHSDGVFIVEDTLEDDRFIDNPLVTGAPFIRFYAGFPLELKDGSRVGTLCVIDTKPRTFDAEDEQSLVDFGEMVESHLESIAQNTIDPLTLISNRRGFELLAQKSLASCERISMSAALLYFDLDYFKEVNDTYGHPMGDKVLKDFAHLLTQVFRESDVIARLGGDEFVVLLSGLNYDSVDIAISRFTEALDSYNSKQSLPVTIQSSIGVAVWIPGKHTGIADLMADADRAMYREKAKHHIAHDIEIDAANDDSAC